MKRKFLLLVALLVCFGVISLPAYAQGLAPSLTVADQVVLSGHINIPDAVFDAPGFLVIHIEQDGGPGPVAGFLYVPPGHYSNLWVPVDTSILTPVVYPMSHYDTDLNGLYEFAGGDLDAPIVVDGNVLVAPVNIGVIDANDQLTDGSFTANSVTISEPGFLVVHISQDGGPGPVLGVAAIPAGTSADVAVEFTNNDILPTAVLYPMLHIDTDGNGVYEFAGGELDGPVVLGGRVATVAVNNAPSMRVESQIVTYADNSPAMAGAVATELHARSVLLDAPGFLVIHTEQDGGPGPVTGWIYLEAGWHEDVVVEIGGEGMAAPTPRLWPMMHLDTNLNGEYEFAGGELDGPIVVDGNVVTFAIHAAPSYWADPQGVSDTNTLTFNEILMDAPGYMVIHDDNNGSPGPVLGYISLPAGLSRNVVVTLDQGTPSTGQVFPMLHFDTNSNGLYEFAGGELDGPVILGGNVVVSSLDISGGS